MPAVESASITYILVSAICLLRNRWRQQGRYLPDVPANLCFVPELYVCRSRILVCRSATASGRRALGFGDGPESSVIPFYVGWPFAT
jgi:hypothetical protein